MSKRSSQVPEYVILEWLSKRETFFTQEFKERFYPNAPQSANMRLNRLKAAKHIHKPDETRIGLWASNVKPFETDPEPINPPVGIESLPPNPLQKEIPQKEPEVSRPEKVDPPIGDEFLVEGFTKLHMAMRAMWGQSRFIPKSSENNLNTWDLAKSLEGTPFENQVDKASIQLFWTLIEYKRELGDKFLFVLNSAADTANQLEKKMPDWAEPYWDATGKMQG